jgi:hypothetical protein
MCRELHERVYARARPDSQHKKSRLNHFYCPQSYPQEGAPGGALKTRSAVFLGVDRREILGIGSVLWRTMIIECDLLWLLIGLFELFD